MQSVSIVTINGRMFFVSNDIPQPNQEEIDILTRRIDEYLPDIFKNTNESDVFDAFLKLVFNHTGVQLSKVDVSHVYRINSG